MPTSIYQHVPTFISYLQAARPLSILDIGIGNGKIGFIAREMLDIADEKNHQPKDWKTRIDGIEIFPEYIHQHQKALYNEIFIGDALKVLPGLQVYDMIILGDVLEHFVKSDAWELIDRSIEHSNNHLVINIPLGTGWEQGEMYGNPHERHRSVWDDQDFKPFSRQHQIFGSGHLKYGIFLIQKEDYIDYRINELRKS